MPCVAAGCIVFGLSDVIIIVGGHAYPLSHLQNEMMYHFQILGMLEFMKLRKPIAFGCNRLPFIAL